MRKILFILLISLVNLVYGQDIKPIDPINFKNLQSPSFSFYTIDSSVWIYKGSVYGWTKLASAKKMQYLIDSLANIVQLKSDTTTYDATKHWVLQQVKENQTLSIDSTNRVFSIGISDGNTIKFKDENTTYNTFTNTVSGLVPAPNLTGTTRYLRQDGTWVVPTDNNTTYSAGTGLSLTGTTFNHSNSVTASNFGDTGATRTLSFGNTFTVPYATYDAQGHITGSANRVLTMPANPNTDSQTLSFTSPNLSISGGNSVDISAINTDSQTLSTTGAAGNISISGGNTIDLNVNDADASTSNEIQDLSGSGSTLSGYVLSLTNDATTVTLPNESDPVYNIDKPNIATFNDLDTLSFIRDIGSGTTDFFTIWKDGPNSILEDAPFTRFLESGGFYNPQRGILMSPDVTANHNTAIQIQNLNASTTYYPAIVLYKTNAGDAVTTGHILGKIGFVGDGATGASTDGLGAEIVADATGTWNETTGDRPTKLQIKINQAGDTNSQPTAVFEANRDGVKVWGEGVYFIDLTTAGIDDTKKVMYNTTTGKLTYKDDIDTNTTYGISAETLSGGANLRLTGTNPTSTDDVAFKGAGTVSVARTDANTITITGATNNDNSSTNEGMLGVGAGAATSSVITSNTSGATGVTVNAGTGLGISEVTSSNGGSITFNHSNSVTASNFGPTVNSSLTFGGTFTVPYATYDAQGHITGSANRTLTMPVNPNTDNQDLSLGTTTATTQPIGISGGTGITLPSATTSLAGLMSAADKTVINGISTNYVPYTGANNHLNLGAFDFSTTGKVLGSTLAYNPIQVTTENWGNVYDEKQYGTYLTNIYNVAGLGTQSIYATVLGINGLSSHDKTQLIFNGENGSIQYRKSWYSNSAWSTVRTIYDSNNFKVGEQYQAPIANTLSPGYIPYWDGLNLANSIASTDGTKLSLSNTQTIKLQLTGGTVQNGMFLEGVGLSKQYYIGSGINLLIGNGNPDDRGFMAGYNTTTGKAALLYDDNNDIKFGASSSGFLMKITSGGNVGIGVNPSQKLDVNGNIQGTQLISTVATGTAPLSVASTTLVPYLNANFLDGKYYDQFAYKGAINTDAWNNGNTEIQAWYGILPDGLTGVYDYGVGLKIQSIAGGASLQFYSPEASAGYTGDLWYRTGWGTSKRDWAKLHSTFNFRAGIEYQAPLTNPVSGTGTTNYLAKFTGLSSLGNSLIYDNGTNVGIGTTTPPSKLTIQNNTSEEGIRWQYTADDRYYHNIYTDYSTSPVYSKLVFRVNNGTPSAATDALVLDGNGRAGIGISFPEQKLDVDGGAKFRSVDVTSTPTHLLAIAADGTLTKNYGSLLKPYGHYNGNTLGDNVDFNALVYYRSNFIEVQPVHTPNYVGQLNSPSTSYSYGQLWTLGGSGSLFPVQLYFPNESGQLSFRVIYSPNEAFSFTSTWRKVYDDYTFKVGRDFIAPSSANVGENHVIPKWTGLSTLGKSAIYDNGSTVGMGGSGNPRDLVVQGGVYPASFYRDIDVTQSGPAGTFLQMGALYNGTRTPAAALVTVLLANGQDGILTLNTLAGGGLAERMRINEFGKVGVGMTNIPATLSVGTPGTVRSMIAYFSEVGFVNGAHYGLSLYSDPSKGTFPFYFYNDNVISSTPVLSMDRVTNSVGIGVEQPAQKLDVDGNIRVRSVGTNTTSTVLGLDSNGDLTTNVTITGGATWKGGWNASANTPTLSDATGTNGWWYKVTVAGTQNLGSGSITFAVGDDVIHNGTVWQKFSAMISEADPIFTAHTVENIVNGTGFLKNNGSGTWSWDNSTYTPTTRTITINGTTQDLSANRIWTVGNVTGPASSTADYFPLFDGTTGKLLKQATSTYLSGGTLVHSINSASLNSVIFRNESTSGLGVDIWSSGTSALRILTSNGVTQRFRFQGNGEMYAMALAANTASAILYYDSNSGRITYGAAPTGGGVTSFNGRTGAVVPATGDYTAAMVTNAAATNVDNYFGIGQSISSVGAETMLNIINTNLVSSGISVRAGGTTTNILRLRNYAGTEIFKITGGGEISFDELSSHPTLTSGYASFYSMSGVPYYRSGTNTPIALGAGGGATTFTSLTDTPGSYTGHANQFVRVNSTATALEFVAGTLSAHNLTFHDDVTITSAAEGELLSYSSGQWRDRTATEAGLVTLATAQNIAGTKSFTNKVTFRTSQAAGASINIPDGGVAPTSPQNGDVWVTSSDAFMRINGVTKKITQRNITPQLKTSNSSFTIFTDNQPNVRISTANSISGEFYEPSIENGATGNIEVTYTSGTCVVTFIAPSTYTLYIADNIYYSATNAYTKSVNPKTGGTKAVYSYYVSGTNIYINGTQEYN